MPTERITITDDDRQIDWVFSVGYTFHPATQGDRITPGDGPRVEIDWRSLDRGVVWIDDDGLEISLINDEHETKHSASVKLSRQYEREITERLLELEENRLVAGGFGG